MTTSMIAPETLQQASGFTDWHVDTAAPDTSVIFESNSDQSANHDGGPIPVPDALRPLMQQIIDQILDHESRSPLRSFTLDVANVRFRAERIRPHRYALRVVPSVVRALETLNLGPSATGILQDANFRSGGLILIAGAPGAGKSTTAVATIVARLKRFGGYCLTIESPIECRFEGFHDRGYVEQIDATAEGFKVEVATAMRKFPADMRSMFYFGEVIEEVAAAELVRLMGRGHLVITTIHAKDSIRAIEMLVALAERGGETYARQLVGGNLLVVIHQQLLHGTPVVAATRINEAMRNIICNPAAPLSNLANEFDLAKRQQALREAEGPRRMFNRNT